MNSNVLVQIHLISVVSFLLIYLIKTILLFSNQNALDRFTAATKVIEMIISTVFFVTGIWLFVVLGAIKVLQIVKLVLVFASIPLAVSGFRRKRKPLAVLSLFLIIMAYGLAEMAKKKPYIPNNVQVNGVVDASVLGQKTYLANCAMCHGKDGHKGYRNAPDLSATGLDQATMHLLIKEGGKDERGVMPAFGQILTEDEINAVTAYVYTLRASGVSTQ